MKYSKTRVISRVGCVLVLAVFSSGLCLGAQENPAAAPHEAPGLELIQPEEKAPPQYNTTSTVLLISGLVGTISGAALCIYSVQFKDGYNSAYASWLATPNSSTLTARDSAGLQYLAPFISGITLGVTGILLTIAGISTGMGGESYQPVLPKLDKNAADSAGLYLFISPTSVGIAIR